MGRYLCTRAMSFPVIAAVLMTLLTLLAIPASVVKGQNAAEFDIVLANGRVIDPESNTDAVRYVGIRGNKIAAISTRPLRGRTVIDAKGLVIAPGFIDLHSHGQDEENNHLSDLLRYGARPVRIVRADGTLAELVEFGPRPTRRIPATNNEYSAFIQDRWASRVSNVIKTAAMNDTARVQK
jgi:hypothetical protein